MTGPLSVDDVHQALLERISSASFPVGSRLPSCRALADQLGSNPSTVDRAIHRLADAGVVRTIPRRGTFVTVTEAPRGDVLASIGTDFDRLVERAAASGLSVDEMRCRFDEALTRAGQQPTMAFVECNPYDLERMATLVENATGVSLDRVLLDGAVGAGLELDREYDVIAAPLFHLADLAGHVNGLDSVVEINFVAAAPVLRRLATIECGHRVVVAAPTSRGLDRLRALVRQYYAGDVERFLIGTDPVDRLDGVDVVVRTHAAVVPARCDQIVIEWELDAGFAAAFRARVAEVLTR
jgi:DNA-binding transcriptional regulator YhcF (GntR family)